MHHLLWLDLSDNDIQLVDSEAFANAKNLQVLLLNNNDISKTKQILHPFKWVPHNVFSFRVFIGEIYQDMLSRSSTLRIINVAHNRLRFLPDTLVKDTQLGNWNGTINKIL